MRAVRFTMVLKPGIVADELHLRLRAVRFTMVLKLVNRGKTINTSLRAVRFTMVLKLTPATTLQTNMFESCAVYDGTQTQRLSARTQFQFESCAVYDGTQTH